MHAQFSHTATDALRVSEIPVCDRLQARQDAGLCLFLLEVGKPLCEVVGLLNLEHRRGVCFWIHAVKAASRCRGGLTPQLSGGAPRRPVRSKRIMQWRAC